MSVDQLLLGNFTENVTWLGTGMQALTSIIGIDLPADLRDLVYDIQNWRWTSEHVMQSSIDAIALLPIIGIVKTGSKVEKIVIKEGEKITKVVDASKSAGDIAGIKSIYNSIKNAPRYPEGFKAIQNGTRKVTINNKQLLDELRQIESGQWNKVYKDGYDAYGNKISIHYFESQSGKVFDVDVKTGWSSYGSY
jgi:hypothetical protein